MSKVVIKAENIAKQYRLGLVGTGTVRDDLKRWWYQMRGKEDPFLKIGEANDRSSKGNSDYVWSLRDINFEINQGDSVGIIGRNGAGKSTLLKILSQVTQPTTGKIFTKGRIASLLEVGTGFHPEMTGRENIYLNGAILGMRKQEITRKFDEIVAFSGVERYIDTPVKRYSSGMYVRLAFAVAAHLESEILIVDEVLAVGDAEFQKKCLGKMNDVSKGEGRTVLFVSHNMAAVKSLCNKGIVLEHGKVVFNSDAESAVNYYLERESFEKLSYNKHELSDFYNSEKIKINSIELSSENFFSIENKTFLKVNYVVLEKMNAFNFSLVLKDFNEVVIFNSISSVIEISQGNYETIFEIPENFLNDNKYKLRLIFVNQSKIIVDLDDILSWNAIESQERKVNWFGKIVGVVRPEFNWITNKIE
ncbi:ABC transporter ATP-binding protein [Flavobacterium cucumis]|uniref:ABC-type polysaccharide/polyol phosphate transport system, ATPase component n=1 Tax=Flavobacterium cucumis TaxID=416016 RepID=A0A1M7ZUF5_9FLAO|nr:ABC transporter ATP-binding protein [Flavobacterium cucumis]SHO72514.1 ABC-type polysaccharide/polyol phosphate transport system, ATPase component [Flavobacterium cucumis]